jgi:hypothetical protein
MPLNADGRLTLTFDGRLEVTLEHEPEEGRLVLWALLAEFGAERPPALLAELLDANFLWRATGGATLALEQGSGKVVLSQALPVAGLEAAALERAIETFVSAAMHWSAHIAAGGTDARPGVTPPQSPDQHHLVRA